MTIKDSGVLLLVGHTAVHSEKALAVSETLMIDWSVLCVSSTYSLQALLLLVVNDGFYYWLLM